jgi:uncharacterized protein (DUF885 family)
MGIPISEALIRTSNAYRGEFLIARCWPWRCRTRPLQLTSPSVAALRQDHAAERQSSCEPMACGSAGSLPAVADAGPPLTGLAENGNLSCGSGGGGPDMRRTRATMNGARHLVRRWTAWAAVVLAAACGSTVAPVQTTRPDDPRHRVGVLADEYAAGYKSMFPGADYFGQTLPGSDTLPDNSLAALSAWQRREDIWMSQLRGIDHEALWGTPEWTVLGYLLTTLETSIAKRACRLELWTAHQYGWQTSLLEMLDIQPVGTKEARAQALTRWSQLPGFLDTEIANLREGLGLGYSAPRKNVELAIFQLEALLTATPMESPFWSPAKRATDEPFQRQWRDLVEAKMVPATRLYLAYLRDEYLPKARTTIGVSANPEGAACYRAQIAAYVSDMAPNALFQLGLKEVADREAKTMALARNMFGSDVPELKAVKLEMDTDSRNRMPGRPEVLAFVRDALARAQEAAPRWFWHVPQAPLAVVPYSDLESLSHPNARYEVAAKDGSRPARYRIDVTNPESLKRAGLEDTAFHEGIPGHHLQMQIASQRPGARGYGDIASLGAFIEGWARYAEGLADEMGLYSSDLDRLGAVAHLPTGLVVDPGIHEMGWTRERAIAYVMDKQLGFSPDAAAAYVDGVAVTPGQIVSYGAGELAIRRLRSQAEIELGDRFDVRAFHEIVLSQGAMPLPLLDKIIGRWIEDKKRGR